MSVGNNRGGAGIDPAIPFKWRHFEGAIIRLCVHWYLRYSLSYRALEEMMRESGRTVDHSIICRWVHRYAPELEQRVRAHLQLTNDSWRVDETSIKVRGGWMYLYRALDSAGNTLEFVLSPRRRAPAAKYFFRKALGGAHTVMPRVINVDKNAAYPLARTTLQAEGTLALDCQLRAASETRARIRLVSNRLADVAGLRGDESVTQGQVQGTGRGDIVSQNRFIQAAFGLAV